MSGARISGLVVCQDNAGSIGAVLDSLARCCDEVVVVDGGSTDGTDALAAARPEVRLYRRPFDGNIGAQKNFGMDQCLGDWILLLDTDEVLEPGREARLRALTSLPRLRWFSLPRRWLVERDGRVGYLASKPWWRDRQVRLFRNVPDLRYDDERWPVHHRFRGPQGWGRPLRSPCILHTCFLDLDRAAREAKVARYLEREPHSERVHRMYLYEDQPHAVRPLPPQAERALSAEAPR